MRLSRRFWITLGLVFVVCIPAFVIYLRRGPSEAEVAAAQLQQLEAWESADRFPFTNPNLDQLNVHLRQNIDSTPNPTGTQKVLALDLSAHETDDLAVAIKGLMQAIAANKLDATLAYTTHRNEAIPQQTAERMRDYYTKSQKAGQAVAKNVSTRELTRQAYTQMRFDSKWESFLIEPSKMSIFRTSAKGFRDIPMCEADRELFENQSGQNRIFAAVKGTSPDGSYLDQNEDLLCADVYIVIRHSIKLLNEPSPYCFRFYFNKQDQMWHVVSLSHVKTVSSLGSMIFF